MKGETLIDTARNLEAMRPDVLVMRHSSAGAPHLLAKYMQAAVVNAGDGMHAHPTQALLDLMKLAGDESTNLLLVDIEIPKIRASVDPDAAGE